MFWILAACISAFYVGYVLRQIFCAANKVKEIQERQQERQQEPEAKSWYFGLVRRVRKMDGGILVLFEDGKKIFVPGAELEFAPPGKIVKIYKGCWRDDVLDGCISN